jgi:NAD kinase
VATNTPRAVFVTRETDYERLLAHHATRDQVRFFLKTRGQSMEDVGARHERFYQVLKDVRAVVPPDWRSTLVHRTDLDRFLFAPDDVVVAVGQDGLVANVAKYLDGQPVLGVNPDPTRYDGILVPVAPDRVARLLPSAAQGDVALQRRTMVEALLDDGQKLLGLNEIFVGHRSHQSARYDIEVAGQHEFQSSSGLIVSSGTGTTGWAHSLMDAMHVDLSLKPDENALAFFVREAFSSVATGTSIRAGKIDNSNPIRITSRMNDGGVIFADGIEHDFLGFDWGRVTQVSTSSRHLNLVMPDSPKR